MPTIAADATLLTAMLKLLETNTPALALQDSGSQEPPGYITLASINQEITKTRQKATSLEETAI